MALASLIAWSAQTAQAAPFVYVAAMDSGTGSAAVYQFDGAAGALSPLSPRSAHLQSLSNPQGVAVHPGGRSVYVTGRNRRTVSQYSVALDGSLTPKLPETVAAPSPAGVAVSPDGRHAYVAASEGGAGQVRQYAIGADGGLLPLTPASVSSSTDAVDIAVSPDGQSVYVTNSGADTVSQYAVAADGTLAPRTPAAVTAGDTPLGLALSPDGQSAYAVNTIDDTVSQYSVGADGTLTPKVPETVATAADSPFAIVVSRDGRHAYASAVGGAVAQYSVAADGALVAKVPPSIEARADSGSLVPLFDVAISPDGRSVYASGSGSVLQFSAGDEDGRLSPMTPASRSIFGTGSSLAVGPVDIAAPPTVSITRPVEGARYRLGQAVVTAFTCTEGSGGPGIATCVDQDGRPSGRPLDTSTSGGHTFEVTATSAGGKTASRTVSYSVNTFPAAAGQAVSIDEDEDVTFGLDVSDVDGDALTATITDAPDRGSVSCAGTVCTYSPDRNAHGEDAFAYVVTDGQGGSAGATVALTIRPVNDPPVAQSQSLTTDEDTNLPLTLTGTDADGGELTFGRSQPVHGGVACHADGCTYDPDTNYNGPDEFTFTVTDDHGETDTGTVSITVRPVNDRPNASGQSLSTDEDAEITFGLDVSDLDGDALSATVSADPTRGSASCSGTTCTYVPEENLHGEDGFAYVVSDGRGGTATATVFVTVRPVADAPVAQDQNVSVFEDAGVTFTLGATDVDGDALTYTPAPPTHGTLDCTGAGCLYRPAADHTGHDTFAFTVSDGNGGTDTGRVDITVQPINDAPVADDRSATVPEDGSTTFSIAATDAEGDTLSTEVSGTPSHGTASCDGLSCTYEPTGDYNGSDSFVVFVDDGHGGVDTATVSVTVTPANDAPTAQNVTVSTDEDTAVRLALLGGDIDGDALTYAVTGAGPQHGTVSCSGALCTYTPGENHHGPDSFTYRVADPSGASASATVAITVNSVVDATALSVPPLLRILTQPLLKLTIPFEARLVRSPGGHPLAGRTITFVVGGQPRCSSVTNAQGIATCTATLPSLLSALLGLGYTAVFDGDAIYAGSSGKGALTA